MREEGERRKEKGEELLAKFELVRTRTIPQGNISFKDTISNLQNYYPLQEKKNVISKRLTYPRRVHFGMLRETCAEGKQFVFIWQATPPPLQWGGGGGAFFLVPPK